MECTTHKVEIVRSKPTNGSKSKLMQESIFHSLTKKHVVIEILLRLLVKYLLQ